MAKTYSLQEQLSVLSDEELDALREEIIKQSGGQAESPSTGRILGRAALSGLTSFAEGSLLGLQGRPISEHSAFKKTDEYEKLLRSETLKNQIDPSRRAAQMELDEIERLKREQTQVGGSSGLPREAGAQVRNVQQVNIAGPGRPARKLDVPAEGVTEEEPPPFYITDPQFRDKHGNMIPFENPERILYDKKKEKRFEVELEDEKTREQREKSAQMVTDSAQDTLDTIQELKKGIRYFGAAGAIPPLPGEYSKVNWRANFDKLVSQKVLDVMKALKEASKTGATGFGQLSNKELEVLQNASTVLKRNMSEQDALRYLEDIEAVTHKILQGEDADSGGGPLSGAGSNSNDPLGIR